MDTSNKIVRYGLKQAFSYIEKNPEENMIKIMDWVDRLAGDNPDTLPLQRKTFRKVLENPDSSMYQLI